MGTLSRYDGRIDIDPPLPWSLIKDSPSYARAGFNSDVRLVIEQDEIDTEDGFTIKRRAVAIVPASEDSFKGYDMVAHVQAVVDLAREGGHDAKFSGYIEAVSEEGDRWRIAVVHGQAREFLPTLTWPAECE